MGINLSVPRGVMDPQLKPRITVIGVGGAGGNAVNNMIEKHLEGVDFVVANTDAQALCQAATNRRIQLGVHTTEGLGAGARPDVGRIAAEEALEMLQSEMAGSHMAFITAGMGGGTGTGAAPVIARAAREMGILTVGVVTKPFHFEGIHRMRLAEAGMEELARYVDTLIIIPNQNLFRIANERTTFAQAFNMADDVLYAGVRGVTDLMLMPGLINLDFADIRTVMGEMGKAMMGTGEAEGEKRALDAAEAAISNPLLDDTSMKGARGVLINITGGPDMTLYEVDEAANRIRDEVDPDANIIFGSTFDERLEGKIRVSVVATGIDNEVAAAKTRPAQDGLAGRDPRRDPPIALKETVEAPRAQPQPQPLYPERALVAEADTSKVTSSGAGTAGTRLDGTRSEGMKAESEQPPAPPVVRPALRAQQESFIPPMPMEARDANNRPRTPSPQPTRAAPPPPPARNPQPVQAPVIPAPAAEVRRAPSLLDRISRMRGGAASRPEPQDQQRVEPRDVSPARPPSQNEAPTNLRPDSEDRISGTSHTEDDLDIPAFLRRQAN
ncbi:MAG: cell division protein FtsZ [Alphaproteobacteria bacterium]|nr:cell division protein FtsZ [Alphaproteobacteria bacterium]